MLEIFHIAMRHGAFKGTLITDLLKFVNTLFDQEVLPESKYIFDKRFAPNQELSCQFYCHECGTYFGDLQGDATCRNCKTLCETSGMNKNNFFIALPIRQQLEELLNKPGIKILPHVNRPDNVIADYMDGSLYRTLCEPGEILSNENALTVTFNTDGAVVAEGSMWPIQMIVNELHPDQRFRFENIVLCGVYFGKKAPVMTTFLRPFIEEMNALGCEGIKRKLPDSSEVVCPVYALSCCVDLIAKAKGQCIMQCNGRFGCGYCYHPNSVISVPPLADDVPVCEKGASGAKEKRKKTERRYISNVTYPYRTHDEMKNDMLRANELHEAGELKGGNNHVRGLKGISALLTLQHFDIVFGFVIDYMHNLAGVTERVTDLIIKSYLTPCQRQNLDTILESFTPPQNILRGSRPLSERANFKCKLFKALLFFFIPILFKGEIPDKVYENVLCLSIGMYVLLKKSILREELEVAKTLLQMFVEGFNDIYGDLEMVNNVHLITHVADVVEKCGPAWCYSAYPFESGNGELLKLVNGTTGIPSQLCKKYAMVKSVNSYMEGRQISQKVLNFCSGLMNYKYSKEASVVGGDIGLGYCSVVELSREEREAVASAFHDSSYLDDVKVEFYNRVILKNAEGNPFYSAVYGRPEVFDDTCVELMDHSYAVSYKFARLSTDEQMWVFVKPLEIAEEEQIAPYIKTCAYYPHVKPLKLIPCSRVKCKAILLKCREKQFVMDFPNLFEVY